MSASGASIAIEDAIVLARLLQSDRPLAAVLDDFMRQRYERCRMIVENFAVYQARGVSPCHEFQTRHSS